MVHSSWFMAGVAGDKWQWQEKESRNKREEPTLDSWLS